MRKMVTNLKHCSWEVNNYSFGWGGRKNVKMPLEI